MGFCETDTMLTDGQICLERDRGDDARLINAGIERYGGMSAQEIQAYNPIVCKNVAIRGECIKHTLSCKYPCG